MRRLDSIGKDGPFAGAAGWLMFSQVGTLFHGVSGKSIPEIVGTLGLQTETQALAAGAPKNVGCSA